MTHNLPFATAQTTRFLQMLAGEAPVTFQTFSDRDELKVKQPGGKDFDPHARIFQGTLEQHQDSLEALNRKGAGVYVMVNAGDLQGRAAKNVLRVRSLFVDTDGAPFPTDLPLMPHIVVESSPGRWHLYWKVDGVALADFGTLQEALAGHYGTDPAVKDLPRVLRLPGFYHRKGEPVMVQLLEGHDRPPYTPADIYKAWDFLPETLARKRELDAERERQRAEIVRRTAKRRSNGVETGGDRARAERLLQAHYDTVAGKSEGTRNATLYRSAYTLGGYVGAGHLEPQEVEDALLAAALICGLPEGEVRGLIPRAVREGMTRPLELDTSFAATPRFDARLAALNQDRAALAKPLLVQPCNNKGKPSLGAGGRSCIAGRPRLGGKPCL